MANTEQLNVRLPAWLKVLVHDAAASSGKPVPAWVRSALLEAVGRDLS